MQPALSGLTVQGSVLIPRLSEHLGVSLQSWLDWAPNSTMLAVATGTDRFMAATQRDVNNCPFLAEPAVRIYSLGPDGSGPLVPCLTLAYHVRPLCWVVWSPDGSRIAAGSYDGSISIWRMGPVSVGELSSHADTWIVLVMAFQVLSLAPSGGLRKTCRECPPT